MTSSSPSSSPPTSSSPGDPAEDPAADSGAAPSTLNLCGEICPFTFVRTKLALEALPIGAVLRVIVDHGPAIRNIPRSAAEWGQEVLGVADLGGLAGAAPGTWAIDLRKRVR
jgi:tRNA 2-thiouridine synthesizing protein A